ncbi:MAG: sulfotransferase [Candidatus Omnitrophica bacterium]|nr:sulfotransferase [Candidatus Omnitrophota bacterium]
MQHHEAAPLFITGGWRSGTTLISRIMNNHPDFAVTYDTIHFMRFANNRYDPINDPANAGRLIADTNRRIQERYNLSFDQAKVTDALKGDYTYASIYDAIMKDFLLKSSGKKFWGEKTNLVWSKIPYFLALFPQGRVIHIIRDPRAVLASWRKFTHAPGNDYLDSIINCYDSMHMALHYARQFSQQRYLFVRYEDLVSDPRATAANICTKFDVPYDEAMLDDSKFESILGDQWKSNTIYDEQLKGISKVMINRWESELKDWEILLTELIMDDMLEKFQYAQSGINKDEKLMAQAIHEVRKSDLATEGMIRFLLTKKGFERYPVDPMARENWGKTEKYEQ